MLNKRELNDEEKNLLHSGWYELKYLEDKEQFRNFKEPELQEIYENTVFKTGEILVHLACCNNEYDKGVFLEQAYKLSYFWGIYYDAIPNSKIRAKAYLLATETDMDYKLAFEYVKELQKKDNVSPIGKEIEDIKEELVKANAELETTREIVCGGGDNKSEKVYTPADIEKLQQDIKDLDDKINSLPFMKLILRKREGNGRSTKNNE